MSTQSYAFCTFRVPGFHRWPEAPQEYKYLSNIHRHLFCVRVEVSVSHNNRAVEFIAFKEKCANFFIQLGKPAFGVGVDFGPRSCEQLATELMICLHADGYDVVTVEVSEDGENGAVVAHEFSYDNGQGLQESDQSSK